MLYKEAMKLIEHGGRASRKAWGDETQYVEFISDIPEYFQEINNLGNYGIKFVGSMGSTIGWIPTKADRLADDWFEVTDIPIPTKDYNYADDVLQSNGDYGLPHHTT